MFSHDKTNPERHFFYKIVYKCRYGATSCVTRSLIIREKMFESKNTMHLSFSPSFNSLSFWPYSTASPTFRDLFYPKLSKKAYFKKSKPFG